MTETFLTLGKEAGDEYIIKRSRFIGYAKPVRTPDEALDFINAIRSRHPDAAHNVYAYVLREGGTRRYSDDGEPQGTAGIPALEVLLKEGLCDCAVVVTRYFGGVMLGAGGLVRAYSHAARLAVGAAGIVKMGLCAVLSIECGYDFYGKLSSLIADSGGVVEDSIFEDNVKLRLTLSKAALPFFNEKLTDMSFGKLSAELIREKFCPAVDFFKNKQDF